MEKTIYHGSDHIIEKPKFGYGNFFDDFGPKVHKAFSFLRSCALKYDGNNDSDGAE